MFINLPVFSSSASGFVIKYFLKRSASARAYYFEYFDIKLTWPFFFLFFFSPYTSHCVLFYLRKDKQIDKSTFLLTLRSLSTDSFPALFAYKIIKLGKKTMYKCRSYVRSMMIQYLHVNNYLLQGSWMIKYTLWIQVKTEKKRKYSYFHRRRRRRRFHCFYLYLSTKKKWTTFSGVPTSKYYREWIKKNLRANFYIFFLLLSIEI